MAKPRDPLAALAAGIVLLGLTAAPALLTGCNAGPTETPAAAGEAPSDIGVTPEPEPTPSTPTGPRVEVVTGGAVISTTTAAAALAEGDFVAIDVLTQVSVADDGRAFLTYPGEAVDDEPAPDFLLVDLPRRVDLEVVAAEPAVRLAELATAGVARVTLAGSDEADVLLSTDVFEARVTGGPADVIVITCADEDSMDEFPAAAGACPGDAEGGWFAVTFGSADVTDASPTDAVAPESLTTPLAKGQAAGFSASGSVIAVLDLGVAAIEDWYDAYVEGADEPLAEIATPTATEVVEALVATVTPLSALVFAAERPELERGECTTIEWDVPGVAEVELNGEPQLNPDQIQACPEETTAYVLEWTTPDGAAHELEVIVVVSGGSGSAGEGEESGGGSSGGSDGSGGGDGDRPQYPTRTPCATREACPIPSLDPNSTQVLVPTNAPPTDAPPTEAAPTDAPPTEPPPTDPPPTEQPPPSPEPATEPPAPVPTEEPAATPGP